MTAHSDHDAISDEFVRQAWDVTPPGWGGKHEQSAAARGEIRPQKPAVSAEGRISDTAVDRAQGQELASTAMKYVSGRQESEPAVPRNLARQVLAEWRAGELTTAECETELAKLGYGQGDPIAVALGAVQMSHPELAAEILRERISGKSLRQIGAEYGISAVRVKQIVVRESIRAMCTCRVPGSNPDCVLHDLNELKAQPLAPDDTDLKGNDAHSGSEVTPAE